MGDSHSIQKKIQPPNSMEPFSNGILQLIRKKTLQTIFLNESLFGCVFVIVIWLNGLGNGSVLRTKWNMFFGTRWHLCTTNCVQSFTSITCVRSNLSAHCLIRSTNRRNYHRQSSFAENQIKTASNLEANEPVSSSIGAAQRNIVIELKLYACL